MFCTSVSTRPRGKSRIMSIRMRPPSPARCRPLSPTCTRRNNLTQDYREIVEAEKKKATVEILHSENSTGMISGIRQRLEEQRKRESPQKTEPSEVALVSNDEYNAVAGLILARFLESTDRFFVSGTARHRAARVSTASVVLDGTARAGKARAPQRTRRR